MVLTAPLNIAAEVETRHVAVGGVDESDTIRAATPVNIEPVATPVCGVWGVLALLPRSGEGGSLPPKLTALAPPERNPMPIASSQRRLRRRNYISYKFFGIRVGPGQRRGRWGGAEHLGTGIGRKLEPWRWSEGAVSNFIDLLWVYSRTQYPHIAKSGPEGGRARRSPENSVEATVNTGEFQADSTSCVPSGLTGRGPGENAVQLGAGFGQERSQATELGQFESENQILRQTPASALLPQRSSGGSSLIRILYWLMGAVVYNYFLVCTLPSYPTSLNQFGVTDFSMLPIDGSHNFSAGD
ncbi:hypothetical protein B0H10DRAFT_1947810 [Mycena sp. CBHHK59/15]|nr:hypothetical protein B0H10DRAFT_1947810 [Mycena sp. CBHHK59/15]